MHCITTGRLWTVKHVQLAVLRGAWGVTHPSGPKFLHCYAVLTKNGPIIVCCTPSVWWVALPPPTGIILDPPLMCHMSDISCEWHLQLRMSKRTKVGGVTYWRNMQSFMIKTQCAIHCLLNNTCTRHVRLYTIKAFHDFTKSDFTKSF